MTLSADLYCPGSSWLHQLDPRTKLALALCSVAILLTTQSLVMITTIILLTHAVLVSAKIPWNRLKALWLLSAPTMLLIIVLGSILGPHSGTMLIRIGTWGISQGAFVHASVTALRIIALALAISIWLLPTNQSDLVRGLVAIGLPYPYGLALGMALRFIPAIGASFRTISDAQQARALDLTKGGLVKRARAYLPIGVAVIITSLRAAENLSRALSSRAFATDIHRTDLSPLSFGRLDAILTFAVIAATAILLWARWTLGLGTRPLGL